MKKKIVVISSFAKDIITYSATGKQEAVIGGPALWISRTLKRAGRPFSLVTPAHPAVVAITVGKREERGRIIKLDKIPLENLPKGEGYLISTIGNEFPLRAIKNLEGFIYLDVQGYVRRLRGKSFLLIPPSISERITIVKATEQELKKIDPLFIKSQMSRVVIITRGKKGFSIFVNRKEYKFKATPIAVRHALGAGDIFFAAFVAKFITTNDPKRAGLFAKKEVEKVLSKRYRIK